MHRRPPGGRVGLVRRGAANYRHGPWACSSILPFWEQVPVCMFIYCLVGYPAALKKATANCLFEVSWEVVRESPRSHTFAAATEVAAHLWKPAGEGRRLPLVWQWITPRYNSESPALEPVELLFKRGHFPTVCVRANCLWPMKDGAAR